MSAKPPMISPVNWLGVVFQIGLIAGSAFTIYHIFGVRDWPVAFLISAVTQAVFSWLMRRSLTREHRTGVKLFRACAFAEAAPHFEASYAAMIARPWIDRFRWLLLGSVSAMTYREMALCNAAFCYAQAGQGEKAICLYEQTLSEYPESSLATASLRMLNSVRRPSGSTSNDRGELGAAPNSGGLGVNGCPP